MYMQFVPKNTDDFFDFLPQVAVEEEEDDFGE